MISQDANAVIINDHDEFSLTSAEVQLFKKNNFHVFNGIEFTTSEGVHVIGVHADICKLQQAPFTYSLITLMEKLSSFEAKILFPHPYHATGVYGNKNINIALFEKAISFANAYEVDNYRYGKTPEKLISTIESINKNAIKLIGSDAHKTNEVGAFVNIYNSVVSESLLDSIFSQQPIYKYNKKRTALYFFFKKFQKSSFYQKVIGLLDSGTRKKIKSFLKI